MDIIKKYFSNLSSLQYEQLKMLETLYPQWNEQINVISRKDIEQIAERHILHSLAIFKYFKFLSGSDILDVGTGGGFPGVPLAIVNPESNFLLADSIGKKIKVVNAIIEAVDLKNAQGQHVRAEKLKQKFDFITSRAVTAFPAFERMVRHRIKKSKDAPSGILYLKGGDFMHEIASFGKRIKIIDLTDYYEEEFFETKKIIHLNY